AARGGWPAQRGAVELWGRPLRRFDCRLSWIRSLLGRLLRPVHHVERGVQERADPPRFENERFALRTRFTGQRARLGVSLLDDRRRLALRLVTKLMGGTLRGDERRSQQPFELLLAGKLRLQVLDAVGKLGALTPDSLEAVGDLLQHLVDGGSLVPQQAAFEADVTELDRCIGHGVPPQWRRSRMTSLTSRWIRYRTAIATIGETSIGPSGGSTRRNSRRYGAQTSGRNRWSGVNQYGSRSQEAR